MTRSRSKRVVGVSSAAALVAVVAPIGAAAPAEAAGAARAWDFNGDGQRDLAIGAAGENEFAGAVTILLGRDGKISSKGAVRIDQDTDGVPGKAEQADHFGNEVASGDFNGDGYADLAVAATGEDNAAYPDAGSVTVFYGGPDGIRPKSAHTLGRPENLFGDTDQEASGFGAEMIAGDFDSDGRADLVVATQQGNSGILVYRGHNAGLATVPALRIGPGNGLPEDAFAFANDLAIGDLDGNGVTDLAVGWLEHDSARGAVAVLYGVDGKGLNLTGNKAPEPEVWTQDSPGVKGEAVALDAFGTAVGIGDVTGDGHQDLVVTSYQEPTETAGATGSLQVLRGGSHGVTAKGDQYFAYDDLVDDAVGGFGPEVAVGDLNGNGVADVAVTHATTNALGNQWGAVLVLYGNAAGLGSHRVQTFTQATGGIGGEYEAPPVDYWGDRLAIRNLGKSAVADLLVADQFQDVGDAAETGMINVLWGSSEGLDGERSTSRTQESKGVPGTNETDDRFGSAI